MNNVSNEDFESFFKQRMQELGFNPQPTNVKVSKKQTKKLEVKSNQFSDYKYNPLNYSSVMAYASTEIQKLTIKEQYFSEVLGNSIIELEKRKAMQKLAGSPKNEDADTQDINVVNYATEQLNIIRRDLTELQNNVAKDLKFLYEHRLAEPPMGGFNE